MKYVFGNEKKEYAFAVVPKGIVCEHTTLRVEETWMEDYRVMSCITELLLTDKDVNNLLSALTPVAQE